MLLQSIGLKLRQARLARNMTQAELAKAAGLSRTTLNRLENGLFPDLGVKKLQRLLEYVGLTLAVQTAPARPRPNYLQMAATSASVSYRTQLTEDQLIRALLSGKVPEGRKPHLRTLFDESPAPLLEGIVKEANHWAESARIRKNLSKLIRDSGASRKADEWLTHD